MRTIGTIACCIALFLLGVRFTIDALSKLEPDLYEELARRIEERQRK